MDRFADETGLTCNGPPRRYLWTDAYAVGNFLALRRATGDDGYLRLAVNLVDQVHQVLGRHRLDDPRTGWISGLSEAEGARHPTRGGLRIGKRLNERAPDAPAHARLEWDQDGQYFHYLTRWMHALRGMSIETAEQRYLSWAAELAVAAHRAFVYETSPDGTKRMFWKMSIDLRRPLVTSMGHHDPLDGLVTSMELSLRDELSRELSGGLDAAIRDYSRMCQHSHWATDDPLGIGGLLDDALRLARLVVHRRMEWRDLLIQLLGDAATSLSAFVDSSLLSQRPDHRLAFRELGLAIGLHGLQPLAELVLQDGALAGLVGRLLPFQPLADDIDRTWSNPMYQRSRSWLDHCNINMVMLATSQLPRRRNVDASPDFAGE
jgi:hypothetical protein